MLPFLTNIVKDWGLIGVLLILLVVCFFVVWKVAKFLGRWESKGEDLALLKSKWETDIPAIRGSIQLLKITMDDIAQKVNPNAVVSSSSPVNLTDIGKEIASDIKADNFIERNAQKLVALIEKQNPKNAYDVQQACFLIIDELEGLLSSAELEIAKKKSVENGMLLRHTLSIFAILLRDKVLENKGWSIGDVDKYNPENKDSDSKKTH